MNVASLELCKELYELSRAGEGGWLDTDFYWTPTENVEDGLYYDDYFDGTIDWVLCHSKNIVYLKRRYQKIPAYDLSYLLRKLPDNGGARRLTIARDSRGTWCACYHDMNSCNDFDDFEADTPEDAAVTLAVDLFKQGVLEAKS